MNDSFQYIGEELDVFALAVNWKKYIRYQISRYLQGDVLEVGAGIGGTTQALCSGEENSWLCLEPDEQLVKQLQQKIDAKAFPLTPEVQIGTLDDIDEQRRFDAILYIDVLEHIEDDEAEMTHAAKFLKPNGALIILSPAHQFLYTPFDKAIGHYRRYNKAMLRRIEPNFLKRSKLIYLDSVGMLLSLGNRLFLRSSTPTASQVKLWDRVFVRCSRIFDVITGWMIGKSILGVWRNVRQLG